MRGRPRPTGSERRDRVPGSPVLRRRGREIELRLRTYALVGLSSLSLIPMLAGCASDRNKPHRQLTHVWRDYQEMPARRAIAIAGDPRRTHWVTGASGGHSSDEAAREGALRECKERRLVRRLQPACVLYAVGDQIVWHGR